jgi:hypothetical protein
LVVSFYSLWVPMVSVVGVGQHAGDQCVYGMEPLDKHQPAWFVYGEAHFKASLAHLM